MLLLLLLLLLLLSPCLVDDLADSGVDEGLKAAAKSSVRLYHVPEIIEVDVVEGIIVAMAALAVEGGLGKYPSKVVGEDGTR